MRPRRHVDLLVLHGLIVDDEAPALAVLTGGGEGLDQALPHPLAGHLDQAERGHLGDLVARPVASQALHEPAQHEVPVGLQNHVDEVDDDHAADVTQAQLTDDLLGGLQVVAGDGLLQRASRTGEAPGVDVDDRHRLGAVDDQGAAAGKPDLAIEALGQLLVDAMSGEDVLRTDPVLEALGQIRLTSSMYWEIVDQVLSPETTSLRKSSLKTSRMTLTASSGSPLSRTGALPLPFMMEDAFLSMASHWFTSRSTSAVSCSCVAPSAAVRTMTPAEVGHDPLEDLLQAAALGVRQLARDPRHGASGDEDQVTARQGDLAGEASTFVTDGVLGDLDQDGVAAGECVLDTTGSALQAGGVPVDLAGVEHGVASLAQVDESGLHGGQDVLNPTDVDVADHGGLRVPGRRSAPRGARPPGRRSG